MWSQWQRVRNPSDRSWITRGNWTTGCLAGKSPIYFNGCGCFNPHVCPYNLNVRICSAQKRPKTLSPFGEFVTTKWIKGYDFFRLRLSICWYIPSTLNWSKPPTFSKQPYHIEKVKNVPVCRPFLTFVETCYVPAGASNFALLLSQMQHVVQRIFHCQKLRNLICLWCNVYSVLLCIDCSFNILQKIVLFLFEGLNGSNLLELIIAINGVKCNA